ncbi:MAG: phosphatidylserine decarboxylase [Lentisphaeria bacterium]
MPGVRDRRTGQPYDEPVLGGGWLAAAYRFSWRRALFAPLFRTAVATRLLGWLADRPGSARRIPRVVSGLRINLDECVVPAGGFRSFNDFFIRRLKPGTRPWDAGAGSVVSPADCRMSAFPAGAAAAGLTVKGARFTPEELLGAGGAAWAARFAAGPAVVARLCPADYHRYHFPVDGRVVASWRVPGVYDSVHPLALALGVPVFRDNLRQVAVLESAAGLVAFVEVGAFGVARIVQTHAAAEFRKMDEKGYFGFGGSTVVLLFEPGRVELAADLVRNSAEGWETRVLVGETIGRWISTGSEA